jgi:hypothetical protein
VVHLDRAAHNNNIKATLRLGEGRLLALSNPINEYPSGIHW